MIESFGQHQNAGDVGKRAYPGKLAHVRFDR
jgi:hypothetical protein